MELEARAPRLGFNLNLTTKNLIIVLMCLVFAGLFAYDGFFGWPENNDRVMAFINQQAILGKVEDRPEYRDWTTWNHESPEARAKMDDIVDSKKTIINVEGWHRVFNITLQRWIASGLLLILAGAMWRFIAQMRLRVAANDGTVSPKQGLAIPWEKITKVDNTEWRSYGIVEITYTDAGGASATAQFDDYKTEREPLLKILDMLAEKAVNAEFIPKEEEPKIQGATVP
jgi:hypothetical protein